SLARAAAIAVAERAAPVVAQADRPGVDVAAIEVDGVVAGHDRDRVRGELVFAANAIDHGVVIAAAGVNVGVANVAVQAEVVVHEGARFDVEAVAVDVGVVVVAVEYGAGDGPVRVVLRSFETADPGRAVVGVRDADEAAKEVAVITAVDVAGEAVAGVGVVAIDDRGVDFEHDRARAGESYGAFDAVEVFVSAAAGVDVAVVDADVARLGCGDARRRNGQEGRGADDPVTHRF